MYVCMYVFLFCIVGRRMWQEIWHWNCGGQIGLTQHYLIIMLLLDHLYHSYRYYLVTYSKFGNYCYFHFLFDWPRFPFHCFDLSVLWQCLLHADNFDPGTWRTQLRSWKVIKIFISTAVCTLNKAMVAWCEEVRFMLHKLALYWAFSDLTQLVGRQEKHPASKNWEMMCWCGYLSGARCWLFVYGPADATASHKPHHLLPHLNPDWFYLSGTHLLRLSWKRGR